MRYLVLRMEDGSFFHLVEGSPADRAALTGLPAFEAFQQGIKDRCAEPPSQKSVTVVGHYRALTSD